MKGWAILLYLLMASCAGENDPRSAMKVEKAVNEKLQKRSQDFWVNCRATATEKASDAVDSILLLQAYTIGLDSSGAPPRPIRPEVIAPVFDPDSTPLKSLIPVKKK